MSSGVQLKGLATGIEFEQLVSGVLKVGAGRNVFVYARGTTTPVQVYSDQGLSVPLSQPLPTGSDGSIPGFVSGGQSIDIVDQASGQRAQAEPIAGTDFAKAATAGTDGTLGGPGGTPLSLAVPTGTGASARQVPAWSALQGRHIYLDPHWVDPHLEPFNCPTDGVTDCASALSAACTTAAAMGWKVELRPITYKFNTPTILAATEVWLNGATIDASGCTHNSQILTFQGATSTALTLTADLAVGASYCKVSGSSPADGTFVKVTSTDFWIPGLPLTFPSSTNQWLGEFCMVRVPAATLNASVGTGDTTIVLNNTQGDARTGYFPVGCPILIGSEQITFTGSTTSSSTITLTGCVRGANSTTAATHASGAGVSVPSGYVVFAAPTAGGAYTVANGAALTPTTFAENCGLTGWGKFIGGGAGSGHVGLTFDACRAIKGSKNLTFTNMDDTAIRLWDTIDSECEAPYVLGGRSSSGDFYGIDFLSACQDVTYLGGVFRDTRHAISQGNSPGRAGITRRVTSIGAHGINCTASTFDVHSAAEDMAFLDFVSEDSLDNGVAFRCPSGKARGVVRRSATNGVFLRNQSNQLTNYDIDVLIEDATSVGVLFRPDVGFFPTVSGSLTSGTTGNVTVSSTTGLPGGYLAFIDGATSNQDEIVAYTVVNGTTINISARGQLGTTAAAHSSGAAFTIANTVGQNTDKIRIKAECLRGGSTAPSVLIQPYDPTNRYAPIELDVLVKDQAYSGAAIQMVNCDHAQVTARVLNQVATSKMVQLINCTHVDVWLNGKFLSQSSGTAISFEQACNKCVAKLPNVENAGTGVAADGTSTNCGVINATGLTGATTQVSLPSGQGHFVNRNPGYQKVTTSTTFGVPALVTTIKVRSLCGPGGGAGAGSAAAAQLQAGGGGGAAATIYDQEITVVPGETLTITIASGGTGGTGGALGGNAGSAGNSGGNTTIVGSVSGSLVSNLSGGRGGGATIASSTAVGNAGQYGTGSQVNSSTTCVAGSGGLGGNPTPYPFLGVVGGAGGGTATATLGGGGGNAQLSTNLLASQSVGSQSGTSAGVNGVTATQPGCGGGGGGGGAAGTGKGGDGGTGGTGQVEMWW